MEINCCLQFGQCVYREAPTRKRCRAIAARRATTVSKLPLCTTVHIHNLPVERMEKCFDST